MDDEAFEEAGERHADRVRALGVSDVARDGRSDRRERTERLGLCVLQPAPRRDLGLLGAEAVGLGLRAVALLGQLLALVRPVLRVELAVLEVASDPREPVLGAASFGFSLIEEGTDLAELAVAIFGERRPAPSASKQRKPWWACASSVTSLSIG